MTSSALPDRPRVPAHHGLDDALFQLANVALWIGDLAAVKRRVDDWGARGATDVHAWLASRPDELAAVTGEMRMVDCNACAVELVEGTDVAATLDGFGRLFLPESYDALGEELQAILDGRERFEWEAWIRTLRGRRRRVRIGARFPREPAAWRRIVVTMLDVTGAHEVAAAHREGETRFRLAARAVHGHIYDFDVRAHTVWRSDGLLGLVGHAPADVPATPDWWSERIHPDDRERAIALSLAQHGAGVEVCGVRYRVRHRDGHYVRVWDRSLLVRDEAGALVRAVGSVTDVTAEEQAFLALRESQAALETAEERSRLALDAARLGTFDYDLRAGTLHLDPRARGLFGLPPDAPLDYGAFLGRLDPADRAAVEDALARAARDPVRARHGVEFRYPARGGKARWLRAYGRIALDGGVPVRAIGVVQDVSEQRAAADRLRAFADAMPQLAWVASADGRNEFMNRRWTEYTGRVLRETEWLDVVHPEDLDRLLAAWDRASATVAPYELEYRLRGADGAYRWFLARGVPQRGADGGVEHWFGTCTDVDEQKRLEGALRANERALREADRRKDEFLATLAHELRNPLAPIRSAARILGSPRLGERELAWSREVIARQAAHMARLLDDLLDVSRITRGRLELRRTRVGLAAVVDAAVETARPVLDDRGHALHVLLPDPPPELDADPVRLAQVLANLLTNAAKYTDPGGRVEVRARVEAGELAIAVRDDGIGLAPEALARVFEMFSQVTTALDRADGGLGIGLALVKGLVELHGGRVHARSDGPGCGSEFVVVLPLPGAAPAAAPPAAGAPATPGAARRVLVADDNRDAAESLRLLLGLAGHEVRVAHDGREALELARGWRPDVALLDIGMPLMNGYEVAAALRAEPWGAAPVLVAVTGWGQEHDRRRAREAGFDRHLTKPIDPAALEALVRAPERTPDDGASPGSARRADP